MFASGIGQVAAYGFDASNWGYGLKAPRKAMFEKSIMGGTSTRIKHLPHHYPSFSQQPVAPSLP